MQKRAKMEWRRSGVVMAPVMAPRWWRASRMSWAMKSAERVVCRDSAALVRAAEALFRAS